MFFSFSSFEKKVCMISFIMTYPLRTIKTLFTYVLVLKIEMKNERN